MLISARLSGVHSVGEEQRIGGENEAEERSYCKMAKHHTKWRVIFAREAGAFEQRVMRGVEANDEKTLPNGAV